MKGENYVLVIAIDKYSDKNFPPLRNARSDSKRLIKVLSEKYGFKTIKDSLYDSQATRRNILEALNELSSAITKEDNLIIYHAGHGNIHPKTGKGYWIPHDAAVTVGDWILHAEVIDYLEGCEAKHLCLITDSCFSGSIFSQTRSIDTKENHFDRLSEIKSRWFLTSGRDEKVSDGKAGKGSPFANSLIKFLEQNSKRQFSISELAIYVENATSNIATQTPRWGSIEALGHEGGQLIFRLKGDSVKEFNRKGKKTWEENFELFIKSKETRPEWPFISKVNPETKSLGVWCQDQRVAKQRGKLSKEREQMLVNAGFIFDPRIEKFFRGLGKFLAYMHKTGLRYVPLKLRSQYGSEHAWLEVQQKWYSKAPCNPKNPKAYPSYRFDILLKHEIPIETKDKEEFWSAFAKDIAKFYETHERLTTIPSQTDKDKEVSTLGKRLNVWMVRWKRNQLSAERIMFLEQYVDKDYELNKLKRSFEVQIQEYLQFRKEFPNEKPTKDLRKRIDVKRVLDWKAQINHRLKQGKSPIHKWKLERLNEINFSWSKRMENANEGQLGLYPVVIVGR